MAESFNHHSGPPFMDGRSLAIPGCAFPWADYVLPAQEEALQQKSGENKAGMGG